MLSLLPSDQCSGFPLGGSRAPRSAGVRAAGLNRGCPRVVNLGMVLLFSLERPLSKVPTQSLGNVFPPEILSTLRWPRGRGRGFSPKLPRPAHRRGGGTPAPGGAGNPGAARGMTEIDRWGQCWHSGPWGTSASAQLGQAELQGHGWLPSALCQLGNSAPSRHLTAECWKVVPLSPQSRMTVLRIAGPRTACISAP